MNPETINFQISFYWFSKNFLEVNKKFFCVKKSEGFWKVNCIPEIAF